MSLLRESEVYRAARRAKAAHPYALTARRILKEQTDPRQQRYDVFLSHSIRDPELVLGAKQILEELGHTVYVDWIEDPQLDRGSVNRDTADILRTRMTCCASLLYLHTENAPSSKWMPWELGYFDGHNGKVAILPVIGDGDKDQFNGQEYLGLYPYVDVFMKTAWVNRGGFISLKKWRKGARI